VSKPPLTIPESPMITKTRPKPVFTEQTDYTFKARPFIRSDHVFQPKLEHRHTEPLDFHLPGDEISERKRMKFEDEVGQALEEEWYHSADFKANPITSLDPDPLPPVYVKPATIPQPFHLATEERGEEYQKSFEERLHEEALRLEQQAQFHANPMPLSAPFIPKKSNRPVTESEPVLLHTEVRREERQAFEEDMKRKELEMKAIQLEEERLQLVMGHCDIDCVGKGKARNSAVEKKINPSSTTRSSV
jgi:hypothetical protein